MKHPGFRHSVPLQLRFKDLDSMGHVNNANHFTYMELARVHYFNTVIQKGIDWEQSGFILAKMVIDYRKPLLLDDKTFVFTRCSRIGNKSFDLEYVIITDNSGVNEIIATGTSVIVCYNYELQESISVPDEWRKKISEYEQW